MQSRIISVINQKGGTGKTTTTINLGSALKQLGMNVLLCDLDPQANLTYSLGLSGASPTMAEVLTGEVSAAEAIIERGGLSVLPGSTDLVDVEIGLVQQTGREQFLRQNLQNLSGYDFVLIDCPPSLSVLTVNALAASTEVLIPLQMEVLTLQGLGQILSTIEKIRASFNPGLTVAGIAVIMYDRRRKLSQEVIDYLQENIAEHVFDTRIRVNVKLAEAPSFGKTIHEYEPSSTGAHDYLDLARELLQRG